MSKQHLHRINWFEIPVTNLDKSAALYAGRGLRGDADGMASP